MRNMAGALLAGAAAGAAGTTALNAVTYLDMAARGRPASSTPQETVEQLAKRMHLPVPGAGETRSSRLFALGSLSGLAAGAATGALLGLCRELGWRPGTTVSMVAATAGALLVGNGPISLMGITDPRSWAAVDWASDVVPHVAYGAVTAAVLDGLDDGGFSGRSR